MVVGDVGADEEDDVGGLHIGIGAGWAVGAEGEFVAGDRGGHAEGGVAVVIASAEAELNEFAESVELLREELASTNDSQRLVAMAQLDIAEALDHRIQSFVPGDWRENTVLTQERLFSAARG